MNILKTKKACALIFLIIYSSFSLASVCEKIEFAELDAMSGEELLQLRCEYRRQGRVLTSIDLSASTRCLDEQNRIDRILSKKLKLTPKGTLFNIDTAEGRSNDLTMQITDICKKNDHEE